MLNRIILKNKNFKIIGFINVELDGKKTLMNRDFTIKGFYDPVTNMTKDRYFRLIGHGDLLTTLI